MVADPADLRRGRAAGPVAADAMARAVDRHASRLDLLPPQPATSPFIVLAPGTAASGAAP